MFNREYAKKVEKYLLNNGHARARQGEFMTTMDALTGDRITCRQGLLQGRPTVAMSVGEDEDLICLTRDFIELVLGRSLKQSQLRLDTPGDDSPNSSIDIDPASGVLVEAALITIEGEELIELFLESRVEPVVLEPGFLVELMLEFYK